ncbi:glycine zipper 2TM domain-containing protein [Sphingopyxis panaciterrulae]|uniref:17 kDa surface antigen n=1 Tax=Sphingopyxis panaciterrulae TaxID=462372 RepID=A0A7W9B434_9SPHN|nr:glycine zipper 2TM domain-containing protein [Sphingopyxis panaciterrulae]MBB5705866.1 hypothetical protein [Sphingopyxis panaciterrulae]
MRTILLLGVAAGSLILSGHATSAEAPLPGPHSDRSRSAAFGGDPRPTLDYGAPAATDTRVYTGYPDRVPSEVDYRGGPYPPPPPPDAVYSGTYDVEGRWTGSWDGTYEAPDGRRYEGRYEGTVEGRPGVDYAPPPYDPYYDRTYRGGYDPRDDADMVRRCGHGNAVGGAVVGGLLGGVAGNRIAGKGDRTAGTLIGGGVGALAGAAIGSEADRRTCEQWWSSRSQYYGGAYPGGTYPGGTYPGGLYQNYGYGYGYGWYSPGVVVTTIINGPPIVTEHVETSTRTYYETVPVRKRHVAKKKWKPKPKRKVRCICK